MKTRREMRHRRTRRIRAQLIGTSERPRLAVFRSNSALYAQAIDDARAKTIVGTRVGGKNIASAKKLAIDTVKELKKHRVSRVVFDRAGYRYHGVVEAFAEGLRQGGIQI